MSVYFKTALFGFQQQQSFASPSLKKKTFARKIHFMEDHIDHVDPTTLFHQKIINTYFTCKKFIVTTAMSNSFLSALMILISLTLHKSQRVLVVVPFHKISMWLLEYISTAFGHAHALHVRYQGTDTLEKAHVLICTPEEVGKLIRGRGLLNNLGTIIWVDPQALSKKRAAYLYGIMGRVEWIRKRRDRRQIILCSIPKVPMFWIGKPICNELCDNSRKNSAAFLPPCDLNYSQKIPGYTVPAIQDAGDFYLPDIYMRSADFSVIQHHIFKTLKIGSESIIIFARNKYIHKLKKMFADEKKLEILSTSDVWLNPSANTVFIDYHTFIDDNTLFRAWLCANDRLVIFASSRRRCEENSTTMDFLAKYQNITAQLEKKEVFEHFLQAGRINPGEYFFVTLLTALFRTYRTLNELYNTLCASLLWDATDTLPLSKKALRNMINALCSINLIRKGGGRYTTTPEGANIRFDPPKDVIEQFISYICATEKMYKKTFLDLEHKSSFITEGILETQNQEKRFLFEEMDEKEKKRAEKILIRHGIPSARFSKNVSKSNVSDPTNNAPLLIKDPVERSDPGNDPVKKENRDYKRPKGAPKRLIPEATALIDSMVFQGVSHPSEIASKTMISPTTIKAYLERQVREGRFIRRKIKGEKGRPRIHYTTCDDKKQENEICGNCAHYTRRGYCVLVLHLHKFGVLPISLNGRHRPFSKEYQKCSEFVSKSSTRIVKLEPIVVNGSVTYGCDVCNEPLNDLTHPIKCSNCDTIYKKIQNTDRLYKAFINRKDALKISFRKFTGFDFPELASPKITLYIRKEYTIVLKDKSIIVNDKETPLSSIKRIIVEKGKLDTEISECLQQNRIFVKEVEVSSKGRLKKSEHSDSQKPTNEQQERVGHARPALIRPMALARVINEYVVTRHLHALIPRGHNTLYDGGELGRNNNTERKSISLTPQTIREKKQWDEIYRILHAKDDDYLRYFGLAEARAAKEKWSAFRDAIRSYYPWDARVGSRLVLEPLGEPFDYSRAYSEIHADLNYLHKHVTFATQNLLKKRNLPSQGLTGILHTSDFVYDVGDSFKTHLQLFLAKNILSEHMKQEYHNSYHGKWDIPVFTLNSKGVFSLKQILDDFWEQLVYYNGTYMSLREVHELWTKKVLHAIKNSVKIDPLELVITYSKEEFEKIKVKFDRFKNYIDYIQ